MPGLDDETTDQAVEPALQHFDDRAFAAAAPVDAGDAGQHAVAVHRLAHLERRQEQVVAPGLRAQEAEPVRIGDHHARHQVHMLRRRVLALAIAQQLAVANHRAQPLAQRLETIRLGQVQVLRERLGRLRPIGRLQPLQDDLAAGDRLGVAVGLTLGVGVMEGRRRPASAGAYRACIARRAAAGFSGWAVPEVLRKPGRALGRGLVAGFAGGSG